MTPRDNYIRKIEKNQSGGRRKPKRRTSKRKAPKRKTTGKKSTKKKSTRSNTGNRVLRTGPRGGKYYVRKGRKVYV